MNMERSENPFPNFPGELSHLLAFPDFIKNVENAMSHMGSRKHGLLGYITSQEEWLRLPANTTAFIPAEDPGDAPPPTPSAPWQAWQFAKQCYDSEIKLLNTATAHFVRSLDEHALFIVEGEEQSIRGKTMAQMIAALRAGKASI